MKRILLVANIDSYFLRLIEIAELLKLKSGYKPVFYFPRFYPKVTDDIQACRKKNISYVSESAISFQKGWQSPSIDAKDGENKKRIRKLLLQIYGLFFVGLVYEFISFFKELKATNVIIKKINPSLVVLAGDNLGYNTATIIKICHKKNIPTILVPSWMSAPIDSAEFLYYDPNNDCKKISNWIMGALYPKWLFKHRGKKMLRWPAFKIVIIKLFGLEPPLPWVLHSGYADAIAAESQAMIEYMVREGLPKDKIILTGSLTNDILVKNSQKAKIKKNALYKDLGLPKNKPMILFAVPPNQLYHYGRPECDFKTYNEMLEFWIKSLKAVKQYNTVIALHPSVGYEKMTYIEKWGGKIAKRKTSQLMPLCDIFVASTSTTIQWAIACAKPVLNYDVYRYRSGEYDDWKGVITVEEKDDYLFYLKKLTRNKKFYTYKLNVQKKHMREWGPGDGKSADRLIYLFNHLILNKGLSKEFTDKISSKKN